eukprot:m.22693 g.22693  ORF g.22693 m.22693 type:complete len:792 (+) comp6905_c0_seq2:107-2482(+)
MCAWTIIAAPRCHASNHNNTTTTTTRCTDMAVAVPLAAAAARLTAVLAAMVLVGLPGATTVDVGLATSRVLHGVFFAGADMTPQPLTLPLTLPAGREHEACQQLCAASTACVAWTFKPPSCQDMPAAVTPDTRSNAEAQQALCWLKQRIVGGAITPGGSSCLVSGHVPRVCNVSIDTGRVGQTLTRSDVLTCTMPSSPPTGARDHPINLQMLGDPGFESTGVWLRQPGGALEAERFPFVTGVAAFQGKRSQTIVLAPKRGEETKTPTAAVVNRGFDGSGLYLKRGAQYNGTLFATCDFPSTLRVALEKQDGDRVVVVAETKVDFSGGSWAALPFSLKAEHSAQCRLMGRAEAAKSNQTCVPVFPGNTRPTLPVTTPSAPTDIASGQCMVCDGQLVVGLLTPGSVSIDSVTLFPADSDVAMGNLTLANRRTADVLRDTGVKRVLHIDHSFAHAAASWKTLRGPLASRAGPLTALSLFDALDFYTATSTEAIVALDCSPQDCADLVEYALGGTGTTWGRRRVSDGHAAPFSLQWVALRHPDAVAIAAMDARASAVGRANHLKHVLFQNQETPGRVTEIARLNLGSRLVVLPALAHRDGQKNTRGFETALRVASNVNAHLGSASVPGDAWPLCVAPAWPTTPGTALTSALSHQLPNSTWLQTAGHVHAIVNASWAAQGLRLQQVVSSSSVAASCDVRHDVTAQMSSDRRVVVVRVVNPFPTAGAVVLQGAAQSRFRPGSNVTVVQVQSTSLEAENTAGQPLLIQPRTWSTHVPASSTMAVPGHSYTVMLFAKLA